MKKKIKKKKSKKRRATLIRNVFHTYTKTSLYKCYVVISLFLTFFYYSARSHCRNNYYYHYDLLYSFIIFKKSSPTLTFILLGEIYINGPRLLLANLF